MKAFGKTIKVSSDSKIRLPKSLLEQMNISPGTQIHLRIEKGNHLVISKVRVHCIVTGKETTDYDLFFEKLPISREGQTILLKELKETLKNF